MDSVEVQRHPYFVILDARWEKHRVKARIAAAYGPRDAINQAEYDHPGYVAVFVERAA